jgi:hypothetical protein
MRAEQEVTMAKGSKRKESAQSGDRIEVGDISGSTGVTIGHGAQTIVTQQSRGDVEAITKAFQTLHQALEEKPDTPKKATGHLAVKGLETEARKGEQASESAVEEWFTSLMAMLPDIAEVAINTFINPIAGVSTVFQKIAKKAKETLAARSSAGASGA